MISDRCTWKLISKVIRIKKENTQYTSKKLLRDNRIYIDKQSICDQLNSHFINVGNGLADKLPKHDIDLSVYLNRTMTKIVIFLSLMYVIKFKANKGIVVIGTSFESFQRYTRKR